MNPTVVLQLTNVAKRWCCNALDRKWELMVPIDHTNKNCVKCGFQCCFTIWLLRFSDRLTCAATTVSHIESFGTYYIFNQNIGKAEVIALRDIVEQVLG